MVGTIALLIGSIIAGLAAAGTSAYAAHKNYEAQKQTNQTNLQAVQNTNDTNYQIAVENRAWQEQMANTAHQREMADLKAAGLNPVLTAMGGSGAGTPSPSVAQMQAPQVQAPRIDLSGVSNAINSLTTLALAATIRSQSQQNTNAARIASNEGINAIRIASNERIASQRNDVLNRLYQRKAERYASLGSKSASYGAIHSASQLSRAKKQIEDEFKDVSWEDLLKMLD